MTYWAHNHHIPQLLLWDIVHLYDSMRPIEPIIDRAVTPHNLGQISTPITSHVMYVPNPPRSSAPGAQPSIPVSSLPSSARGQPPA